MDSQDSDRVRPDRTAHPHGPESDREGGDSGRIIGGKASYTPRFSPKTGKRLESFWSNGNIDERKQVIYIRARRAVVVGTGGFMGNIPFRTQFDPRMSEPSMQYSTGLMGPLHEDASGILAGMKVGAGLGGLYQANLHANTALRLGLVSEVVPAADLAARAGAVAALIAGHSPHAVRQTRGLLERGASSDYQQATQAEALAQGILGETADHQEAVRAFVEKRPPVFTGK